MGTKCESARAASVLKCASRRGRAERRAEPRDLRALRLCYLLRDAGRRAFSVEEGGVRTAHSAATVRGQERESNGQRTRAREQVSRSLPSGAGSSGEGGAARLEPHDLRVVCGRAHLARAELRAEAADLGRERGGAGVRLRREIDFCIDLRRVACKVTHLNRTEAGSWSGRERRSGTSVQPPRADTAKPRRAAAQGHETPHGSGLMTVTRLLMRPSGLVTPAPFRLGRAGAPPARSARALRRAASTRSHRHSRPRG